MKTARIAAINVHRNKMYFNFDGASLGAHVESSGVLIATKYAKVRAMKIAMPYHNMWPTTATVIAETAMTSTPNTEPGFVRALSAIMWAHSVSASITIGKIRGS